jgi:hypothetical protein
MDDGTVKALCRDAMRKCLMELADSGLRQGALGLCLEGRLV